MRRLFLFLCLCSIVNASELYHWSVTRVLDGDTVEVHVDFLPKELGNKLYVRVWGVDTPEKGWRAKSEKENTMGLKASEFTKNAVQNAKTIEIQIVAWDKFGGRILGDVIIDGKSLRQMLLENGYAREYYGDKKLDW